MTSAGRGREIPENSIRNARIATFFLLLVIGAFLGLGVRCFYLQQRMGGYYLDACVAQQRSFIGRSPRRGVILDCRGRILAASNKEQRVFAEPRVIEDVKATASSLQDVLNVPAHELCRVIMDSNNPGYVVLKDGVSAIECDTVLGQGEGMERVHHGVGVESIWQRYYPTGSLFSTVVGFTSRVENRGLSGIEYEHERELCGTGAREFFMADVARRPIMFKGQSGELTNGVGLVLTVDATIQQFAREELLARYELYKAESAIAVVADPRTGAILAMVSLPDFDPSRAGESDPNNFRSRVVTDEYEPGSILKPISAAIALDSGVVNTYEKIDCEHGHYGGRGFGFGSISEYRNGFGDLTVREILMKSSNIGMAKIGQRLGAKKLYEGLRLFGFGRKVGIELPGEADGKLHPAEQWTGYSVTRVPFGQEISVTGIQLVRAFCILANGGRLVRPYLVKAMIGEGGEIIDLKRPVPPVGYVIKPVVAKWVVTEAMAAVVNEGTGKRAKLEKWQVFGKTGTANIAKKDGRGYAEGQYVASFICGAPAEDPRIVVLVSIRNPKRSLGLGYTGGVVSSPVAGKIVEKTLTYFEKQGR